MQTSKQLQPQMLAFNVIARYLSHGVHVRNLCGTHVWACAREFQRFSSRRNSTPEPAFKKPFEELSFKTIKGPVDMALAPRGMKVNLKAKVIMQKKNT